MKNFLQVSEEQWVKYYVSLEHCISRTKIHTLSFLIRNFVSEHKLLLWRETLFRCIVNWCSVIRLAFDLLSFSRRRRCRCCYSRHYCCMDLQVDTNVSEVLTPALMMEAVFPPKHWVPTYKSMRYYNPENQHRQKHTFGCSYQIVLIGV
jgi:hypothetical protein